ncbi:MAG: glutamate-5-semialdehyde dehydrogenase [Pseudomonadota bacterium]
MTYQPQSFDTLNDYMLAVGQSARDASRNLAKQSAETKSSALKSVAHKLHTHLDTILAENARDVVSGEQNGLSEAMLDRLTLTPDRVEAMAASVEAIAAQADPVNAVLDEWTQPNGLHFRKVTTPLGVIGMIYESRPNVTADAAALCLKSGNAVILRGGSEAVHSNHAIYKAIQEALKETGIPQASVQLIATQDRDAVGHLLGGLNSTVDMIIPRGGKGLVARVQTDARVPVLAHLDGLNHTYIHTAADSAMAIDVIGNAKMRRTGICGATETVLVDQDIATNVIPNLVATLSELGCEIRGDSKAQTISPSIETATEDDFNTEHLAAILNLAIVDNLDSALRHIERYGSGHTDAIITSDEATAERFLTSVDSAIVLHNASTQFADGGEFGFGAEIGIATGRLHARGPVGAQHLTSYKYQVVGNGTLRP